MLPKLIRDKTSMMHDVDIDDDVGDGSRQIAECKRKALSRVSTPTFPAIECSVFCHPEQ